MSFDGPCPLLVKWNQATSAFVDISTHTNREDLFFNSFQLHDRLLQHKKVETLNIYVQIYCSRSTEVTKEKQSQEIKQDFARTREWVVMSTCPLPPIKTTPKTTIAIQHTLDIQIPSEKMFFGIFLGPKYVLSRCLDV